MTLLSPVPRITIEAFPSVTPVISTPAYTANDQVGGIQELTNIIRQDATMGLGSAILTSVTILDKDSQNAAFNLWFFKISPTLASSDNAAMNLTDANLLLSFIGVVSVGTTYAAGAVNSVSTTSNLNLPVFAPGTATTPTSIYVVAQTTGTPTYASTSSLVFQYSFLVD